ncbi:SufB/SufD family protein [Desulfurobacterium atlanticum]|uniref:SUF system FeS cluster assembly SufBD core domain-containing protein n=1 Tax=Desulfurobacterium atlanticum TaxID=240169 RepID=A0A238YEE5_9BACT|nr:SufD family Fe-S cluster assembly protein [Desulfurobacterium atlanticum]SNR69111.1 hypothetical protein SAMN06265340_10360 [Desulfurobacterium atlanticum]
MKGTKNGILDNLFGLGLPKDILKNPSVIIEGHDVIREVPYPGIVLEKQLFDDRVDVTLTVLPGVKVDKPVHFCLSKLGTGDQLVNIEVNVGKDADIKLISHCAFKGGKINHRSKTKFKVAKNASLDVTEIHYHSEDTDILIDAYAEGVVEERGFYKSLFKINTVKAGKVNIKYKVDVMDYANVDIEAKIAGKDGDEIYVTDVIYLKGKYSRAIAKSRLMALGNTVAEFYGETYGLGDYSRGHIDCSEVIRSNDAKLKAVPIVVVNNETAKVTHEAAIGSLDKKQLETLMARGLTEDEAVEVIVQGMLR